MLSRPWHQHYDYWVGHAPDLIRGDRSTNMLDATAVDRAQPYRRRQFLGATLTFWDLKERCRSVCRCARAARHRQGRSRGHHAAELPQYVIAAFAVLRLGAIIVNLNPDLHGARGRHRGARRGHARAGDARRACAAAPDRSATRCSLERIIVTSLARVRRGGGASPARSRARLALADVVRGEAVDPASLPRARMTSDDVAVLQYTGGTTGTPKGGMLDACAASSRTSCRRRTEFMRRSLERGGVPLSGRHSLLPYLRVHGRA